MAAHHCPSCGGFSWHGPGSVHWALVCPFCGHKAAQVPHAPNPSVVEEIVAEFDTATVDAPALPVTVETSTLDVPFTVAEVRAMEDDES